MIDTRPDVQSYTPPPNAPVLREAPLNISTGASSVTSAMPNRTDGQKPNTIRIAVTQATYVRFGAPSEATAVPASAGANYSIAEVITLAGGTGDPMKVSPATVALVSASVDDSGSGYAPAMALTLAGGTSSVKAVVTIDTTKVTDADVVAGGTGDLGDGAGVIVVGTTGTGTKFRASVTILNNAINSVELITVEGAYTANPTTPAVEPVTYVSGASSGTTLTGATLSLTIGVLAATVTTPGNYSLDPVAFTQFGASSPSGGTGVTFNVLSFGILTVSVNTPGLYSVNPTNPVSQASTTGSGAGATFTLTMASAATANDLLVMPGAGEYISAQGKTQIAALRVSVSGVLQVAPVDNS